MKKLVTLIVGVLLITVLNSTAQKATQWRGENSMGIYPAENMMQSWPETGPEIIWHFDQLGEGHSSPVFANNNIYITGMINNQGILFVFDTKGNLLKQYDYGKEYEVSWPGTRSSVTIVGNLAYLYSGYGKLGCLDLDNGNIKWTKDLFADFDGGNITWGVTESVVVDGDRVFVSPGGKINNVVALNRFTGNLIWSCAGLGELSAYNTPLLINLQTRQLLVVMMASNILGIDASDGKLLWNYEQPNKYSVHANTPIYHDGSLLCISGYGKGSVKLKLAEDGSSVTKEWFSTDLDNRMGGAVLIDGYIYGTGDANSKLTCVDWKTGETKYKSEEVYKGVVIASGNKLIVYSEKGDLLLAEANPTAYKPISKTKVELGLAQHWAHPVINKGILYLRHGNVLIAYKISQ